MVKLAGGGRTEATRVSWQIGGEAKAAGMRNVTMHVEGESATRIEEDTTVTLASTRPTLTWGKYMYDDMRVETVAIWYEAVSNEEL